MTHTQQNYIAGEWVSGPSEIENINPSDLSEIVGVFAQASGDQLDDALNAARRVPIGLAMTNHYQLSLLQNSLLQATSLKLQASSSLFDVWF